MTTPLAPSTRCSSCTRPIVSDYRYDHRDRDLALSELRGGICSTCAMSAGYQPREYPAERQKELHAVLYRHGLAGLEPTQLEADKYLPVTVARRRGRLVRRYATARRRLENARIIEAHVRRNLTAVGWKP
jgi:hypothetical protein